MRVVGFEGPEAATCGAPWQWRSLAAPDHASGRKNACNACHAFTLPCCLVQAPEQPEAWSEEEEDAAAVPRVLVPGLTIEINLDALRHVLLPPLSYCRTVLLPQPHRRLPGLPMLPLLWRALPASPAVYMLVGRVWEA